MFARLRNRIAQDGIASLLPWAAQWLYWQGGLSRLPLQSISAGLKRNLPSSWQERLGLKPRICESVVDWMPRHGQGGVKMLYEPTTVTLKTPHTLDPQMLKYDTALDYPVPGKYLAPIRRARLKGASGLVILPDGSYSREAVYLNGLLEQDPDFKTAPQLPLSLKRGNYFSLVHIWAARKGNYYHWIHDTLLRLYRVQELLPNDIRYIVPAGLQAFHFDSLEAFGIRRDQLEFFDAKEIWELETLFFTPHTSWSGRSNPEAVSWLRERILSGSSISSQRGGRRLFISRRLARQRRITNEADIETLLRKYSFETVTCEEMTFREQVALFAQAEMVVASHGAGLTNLLWAATGGRVLEIFEPGYAWNAFVYWTLCDALGLGYWCFESVNVPREGFHPDTFIPIETLETYMNWMLRDVTESSTA